MGRTRSENAPAILVVEDEGLLRMGLARLLGHIGFEVVAASSAEEALRVLEESGARIDVVLADVVLPGTTGPQMLARLRERRPFLRGLYMSAHDRSRLEAQGLLAPDDPLLEKPFSIAELRPRLVELLGERT